LQVTRNFAMLHAKNGVRINSVNPGYVLTDVYGENFASVRRFPILNIILAATKCFHRCNSWPMTLDKRPIGSCSSVLRLLQHWVLTTDAHHAMLSCIQDADWQHLAGV